MRLIPVWIYLEIGQSETDNLLRLFTFLYVLFFFFFFFYCTCAKPWSTTLPTTLSYKSSLSSYDNNIYEFSASSSSLFFLFILLFTYPYITSISFIVILTFFSPIFFPLIPFSLPSPPIILSNTSIKAFHRFSKWFLSYHWSCLCSASVVSVIQGWDGDVKGYQSTF